MKIAFLGNFGVDYSSENHHAKSLEALGHEVIRLQEGQADSLTIWEVARHSNLFIWIHTHGWTTSGSRPMSDILRMLKESGIPTLTYHLDLWFGLERQKDLESDPFYKEIEWFFATDKLMCDWFNENTNVKGRYLPAGVYHEECYLEQVDAPRDVIFVGSKGYHPEWQYRPQLINWLQNEYGDRFEHWGGDGLKTIRGHELNRLYQSTKVVVGDSLCLNFDYPYYWSDRVYETMGRGGFLIMPRIKGLDEQFEDGKHLVFYEFGDFDGLKEKIDYYLSHAEERELIRRKGHEEVRDKHTYKHRWQTILDEVFHGQNG